MAGYTRRASRAEIDPRLLDVDAEIDPESLKTVRVPFGHAGTCWGCGRPASWYLYGLPACRDCLRDDDHWDLGTPGSVKHRSMRYLRWARDVQRKHKETVQSDRAADERFRRWQRTRNGEAQEAPPAEAQPAEAAEPSGATKERVSLDTMQRFVTRVPPLFRGTERGVSDIARVCQVEPKTVYRALASLRLTPDELEQLVDQALVQNGEEGVVRATQELWQRAREAGYRLPPLPTTPPTDESTAAPPPRTGPGGGGS